MSSSANAALADPWKDLWNGDLSITDKIITEDFVAHAAPITGTGPDEIRGRDALNAWVGGIHAIFPDLNFTIDVGPITDDKHHLHRHRYPAHRRRPARRILGQRRQPAVPPAARRPRSACPKVTRARG